MLGSPTPGSSIVVLPAAMTGIRNWVTQRQRRPIAPHQAGGSNWGLSRSRRLGDPGAELRKWITASSPPPPLAVGNQVFLLQHPEGKPLRLTIGTVTEFNEAGTRVRYDANSLGGASGSPLFDADLQLVALHHAHDLARPPRWNEAIPLGVIQAASRAHDVILH